MARFEHIIQINAFDVPGLPVLSRAQVWRGLWLRAYDPAHFIMGLESSSIISRTEFDDHEVIERILDYGSFKVHDRVILHPMQQTRVEVAESDGWPRCSATCLIEEPEPESLFIRFVYEWDPDAPSEADVDDKVRRAREQAYVSADMDTVQRIREIAGLPM